MSSQEVCEEVIDRIVRANAEKLPHQPLGGTFAHYEETGVHYLVYLIGSTNKDPVGLRVARHATTIRHAGGVLCTDATLANHLKWTCYRTYQEQYARGHQYL